MGKVLTFDIGGTAIKSALIDSEGNFLSEKQVETPKEYELIVNKLKEIADLQKEDYEGVSIAVPGGYDFKNNKIFAPNLSALNNNNIKKDLEDILNKKVVVENDANLAALGEYIFADKKSYRSLAFITLGTGVGGGMIINGELLQSDVTLFEVGHMSIDPHGKKCECGRRGCIDEYLSAGGLASIYRDLSGEKENITPRVLAEWLENKDKRKKVLETFDIYAKILAEALANIANLFCPDKIKIGGGISAMEQHFLPKTKEIFDEIIFPLYRGRVSLEPAKLGNKAGMLGAAGYFWGR